jgi:hypothetical protein
LRAVSLIDLNLLEDRFILGGRTEM